MVLDIERRRLMRNINSKFIFGKVVSRLLLLCRLYDVGEVSDSKQFAQTDLLITFIPPTQPLVHLVIFIFEMAILSRLAAKFNSYYNDRPSTLSSTYTKCRPEEAFDADKRQFSR